MLELDFHRGAQSMGTRGGKGARTSGLSAFGPTMKRCPRGIHPASVNTCQRAAAVPQSLCRLPFRRRVTTGQLLKHDIR
jgi:hypothetical protein